MVVCELGVPVNVGSSLFPFVETVEEVAVYGLKRVGCYTILVRERRSNKALGE